MELFTPGHLVIVLIVALVLFFGWKQLPDAARSLGRSLRVFKTEIKGMSQDDDARKDAENSATATATADERAAQNGLGVTPPAIESPRAQTVPNPASRPRPTPDGRPVQSDASGRAAGR